jgi:hypothetical protein
MTVNVDVGQHLLKHVIEIPLIARQILVEPDDLHHIRVSVLSAGR